MVQSGYGDTAGVDTLLTMMNEPYTELKHRLQAISVFGKRVANLLKAEEGQEVAPHKAYNALFTLWRYLKAASLENLEALMKKENVPNCEATPTRTAEETQQCLDASDSWKLLKNMRALDLLQLKMLSHE